MKRSSGGIDSVVRGYEAQEVRDVSPMVIVAVDPISCVLAQYETFLGRFTDIEAYYIFEFTKYERVDKRLDLTDLTDILTPEQINIFLQSTIAYENRKGYNKFTGIFITKLLQNSYDAGHNEFELRVSSATDMHYVGVTLLGTEDRLFSVSINGNGGMFFGREARYCQFTVNGNVGWYCGYRANNSYFTINGDSKSNAGAQATNSTFFIQGSGQNLGHGAQRCEFTLHGKDLSDVLLYKNPPTKYCTFKTSNRETLDNFFHLIGTSTNDSPEHDFGNRIIFIDSDGKEEVITR